ACPPGQIETTRGTVDPDFLEEADEQAGGASRAALQLTAGSPVKKSLIARTRAPRVLSCWWNATRHGSGTAATAFDEKANSPRPCVSGEGSRRTNAGVAQLVESVSLIRGRSRHF